MSTSAIICVDDDLGILSSLEEQLSRNFGNECEIELASSAGEALQVCAELVDEGVEVPVLISDQQMPGIQGDELLIQIHCRYPQTLTIMLTGHSNVEAVSNAVNAANLYRFIPKPWNEADLVLTVREALRRYTQDNQLVAQRLALQEANAKLERSLSLLQATLESTADGILVVDSSGAVTHFNRKLTEIWDLDRPNDSARVLTGISKQLEDSDRFGLANWQHGEFSEPESYEIISLKNGRVIECLSQPQSLNQQVVGRVWSFRDVTKRQQAEETIRYQANHDVLTGLANRRQFKQRLIHMLARARGRQGLLAVFFIDLDRFKLVNDSYGHAIGDRLLQEVVKRLKQCCRNEDVLARWGGDEFTMALPHLQSRADTEAIAQRLLKALQPSFDLAGYPVCITSSIGIAIYPDDGQDADTLLKNADTALYRAKEKGRNDFQQYTSTSNTQGVERLALEYALNQALEQSEFSLVYQPQVDIETGAISHMEALVRWQHPKLGTIAPSQFIPIAEQNGSIFTLGQWVLHSACAQAKTWQSLGVPVTVAVNLSPRQLQDRSLVQTIERTLIETDLDSHFLELEITESATLHNVEPTQLILAELRKMGISIALDDFGTGYSSLSYLKQFPLDALKIDRSFIRDLLNQDGDVAIAKAILQLGQGLGLRVVAEGVETEDLKLLLQSLNCQHMQGYLFSRPLPAREATCFLKGV